MMDILKNIVTKLKNSVQVEDVLARDDDCNNNNNYNENIESSKNLNEGCPGCSNVREHDNTSNIDQKIGSTSVASDRSSLDASRLTKSFCSTGKAPGTASRLAFTPRADHGATSVSPCFVGKEQMPTVHSISNRVKTSRRKLAVAGTSLKPLGLDQFHKITEEGRLERVHFCERNLRSCKVNEVDTVCERKTKWRPGESNPRDSYVAEDRRHAGSTSRGGSAAKDGRCAWSNPRGNCAVEDGRRAGSNTRDSCSAEDCRRDGSYSGGREEDSCRAGSNPRGSWAEDDSYCENKKTAAWFLGPKARNYGFQQFF
jgi:hypothetical protein